MSTFYPTEVKRYTVRLKLERIASALRHLREWDLAPQDRQALRYEIHAEVTSDGLCRLFVIPECRAHVERRGTSSAACDISGLPLSLLMP